jgi:hypothetical protein
MVATKALRWLTFVGALAMTTAIAVHGVMAQEDDSDAAKTKHTAIHASGPVAIAGSPCASPTAGVECYSITSSALKDGKVTNGTLTGSLLVSTTTSAKGKAVCYTILGASTETIGSSKGGANLDFGPASACIKTNAKKTSTESVLPAGPWTTAMGSPETGSGKETWKVAPTDATSQTSPLAGSGTVHFTGSVSP